MVIRQKKKGRKNNGSCPEKMIYREATASGNPILTNSALRVQYRTGVTLCLVKRRRLLKEKDDFFTISIYK